MSDQALDNLSRCPWPKQDPLYVSYHDKEWGAELRGQGVNVLDTKI